jgi:hypothetical protein
VVMPRSTPGTGASSGNGRLTRTSSLTPQRRRQPAWLQRQRRRRHGRRRQAWPRRRHGRRRRLRLASTIQWEEAAVQPLRPGRCVVLPRSVWGLGATERG